MALGPGSKAWRTWQCWESPFKSIESHRGWALGDIVSTDIPGRVQVQWRIVLVAKWPHPLRQHSLINSLSQSLYDPVVIIVLLPYPIGWHRPIWWFPVPLLPDVSLTHIQHHLTVCWSPSTLIQIHCLGSDRPTLVVKYPSLLESQGWRTPHSTPLQATWLVVSTPLKNMSSSVGMMTFPTEWKV